MTFLALFLIPFLVMDGDTFRTSEDIKCRIYGVDAPEKKQAHGADSAIALNLLLDEGYSVQYVGQSFDRKVCKVTLRNGDSLSELLIKNGAAWFGAGVDANGKRRYIDKEDYNKFNALESTARNKKIGLWADIVPPTPPWEFRAKKKVK